MNQIDFITPKEKFKHLNEKKLEYIIREYNDFMSTTKGKFRAKNKNRHLKVPKHNIRKLNL